MKDKSYTIRASLGTWSNPFLSSGLAGNLSWQATPTPASSILPTGAAQTGASGFIPLASSTNGANLETLATNSTLSDGLSTGAKTGVGVGVSVGILSIAGLVTVCLMRRRRRQTPEETVEEGPNAAELHDQGAEIHEIEVHAKHELDSNLRNEVDGSPTTEADSNPRSELESQLPRTELAGVPACRSELDGTPEARYEMEADVPTRPS